VLQRQRRHQYPPVQLFHALDYGSRSQESYVIAISSGQTNLDAIPKLGTEVASLYAISKAGLNTSVARFKA
jgi:hypothetical protein